MNKNVATAAFASVTSLFVLAVCCGWPDYAVKGDGDATTDETGLDEIGGEVEPYDVATVACDDAGLRSGQAAPCACDDGGVIDAGPDAEAGAVGQQACTLEGGLGACIGCPASSACDTVTAPLGTTCIAGGLMTLGATNKTVCPPSGCAVEMPEHPVAITRYFLDEREVTVKAFRSWWKDGHVTPSAGDVVFTAGDGTEVKWDASWSAKEPIASDGMNNASWKGDADATNDALPINFVDWPTALAFCVASGGRLPTEAEWEAAASGRAGRIFPREDPETRNAAPTAAMLPCTRAVSGAGGADCGPPSAPPSGSERYSFDGAYDLAGSVAEWVLDVQPPGGSGCPSNCYPSGPTADPILWVDGITVHPVRGGSWMDTSPAKLRAQARSFETATTQTAAIGFRCARR
ncbi:MAG: formylglycine-generating enzyme family protein [Polyangiales bacterium]